MSVLRPAEGLLRMPICLSKLFCYYLFTSLSSPLDYKFLEGGTVPLLILSFSELNRVQSTELMGHVKKKKKGRQVERPLIYNPAGAEKHFQGALGARRESNHVFTWAVRKPQERHPDDVACPLIGGSKENPIKSRDCLKDPPNPLGLH